MAAPLSLTNLPSLSSVGLHLCARRHSAASSQQSVKVTSVQPVQPTSRLRVSSPRPVPARSAGVKKLELELMVSWLLQLRSLVVASTVDLLMIIEFTQA